MSTSEISEDSYVLAELLKVYCDIPEIVNVTNIKIIDGDLEKEISSRIEMTIHTKWFRDRVIINNKTIKVCDLNIEHRDPDCFKKFQECLQYFNDRIYEAAPVALADVAVTESDFAPTTEPVTNA